MVEHDEDTMRAADCVVDIGPGAGEHGGKLVEIGTAETLMAESGFCHRRIFKWQDQDSGADGAQTADRVA